MEEFEGLFICSTNLIDNLDQASFRRFGAKIRFDYLKPGQCRAMFESELKLHGIEPGDVDGLDTLLHSVERLQNLTPGDFATVRRKLKMLDTKLSPKLLYEMLTDEITAKHEDGAKSVGF
jgi:SpoVK/Ycf46/Vps4 family AAA+-type ATPase